MTDVSLTDAGDYSVIVANAGGAATSAVAHLTVLLLPQLTLNGGSIIALKDSSTTLTANIQGTEPLTYQWYFRNRPLGGATGAQLTLSNITTKAIGTYTLEVRNAAGVARSQPVTLRVVVAPAIRTQPKSLGKR